MALHILQISIIFIIVQWVVEVINKRLLLYLTLLKAFVISVNTSQCVLKDTVMSQRSSCSAMVVQVDWFFPSPESKGTKGTFPQLSIYWQSCTRTIRYKFLISCYLPSVHNEWACLEKGNCSQTSIPSLSFPAVQEIAQNILMSSLFFLDSGCSDFFLRNTISTWD